MKWPVSKTVSVVAFLGVSGLSYWARGVLPDAPLAVHFNAEGIADGFMARDQALLFGPVMLLAITLLFWVLPYFQTKTGRLERSEAAYGAAWVGTVAVVTAAHGFILSQALGWQFEVRHFLLVPALLFIVLGNYMPKMRYNPVMGIRTPWTLRDERVWDKTHRFSGPIFMLAGALMAVGAFVSPPAYLVFVFTSVAVVASAVTIAASWVFSRQIIRK